MTPEKKDWRELCAAVANELDSERVLDLVEQLVAALDERKSNARFPMSHELPVLLPTTSRSRKMR
jgi:hypothetical protein